MFKVVMSLLFYWDRIVNVWMVQVHLYQVAPNFSYNPGIIATPNQNKATFKEKKNFFRKNEV